MKHLKLTTIGILITIICQAQFGITAGTNISHFIGSDYGKSAIGFSGGFYDEVKIGNHFSIQPEVLYEHKGSKNIQERNVEGESRVFSTYSIDTKVFFSYRIKSLTIGAAPTLDYYVYAKDGYPFYGPQFGWSTSKWDYWRKVQAGYAIGVQIDLHNALLKFTYDQGISNVRNKYYQDNTLWKNHNQSVSARLSIPFNTLFNPNENARPLRIKYRNHKRQWQPTQSYPKF